MTKTITRTIVEKKIAKEILETNSIQYNDRELRKQVIRK